MAQIVTHTKQRNILCRNFTLWQEQTQKLQLATKLYNIKLVRFNIEYDLIHIKYFPKGQISCDGSHIEFSNKFCKGPTHSHS
jgi:hypothetical protein